MFDLLHMDLRRLVRDRALYIILAVFGVILLFVCVMMALTSNGDLMEKMYSLGGQVTLTVSEQGEMLRDAADAQLLLAQTTRANFFYTVFCSGGGLSVFIVILSTVFVYEDFSSGFAKNIFSVHRRGVSYLLSKSAAMLCAVTGFLVFGTLFTHLLVTLFRMPLAAGTLSDFARYFFQAWLTVVALAVQNVFFVVWTRSIAVSMILSFCCAGGVFGIVLGSVGKLFRLDLVRFTLAGACAGDGLNVFSAVVCLCWIGVYLFLGTWALRRRDI